MHALVVICVKVLCMVYFCVVFMWFIFNLVFLGSNGVVDIFGYLLCVHYFTLSRFMCCVMEIGSVYKLLLRHRRYRRGYLRHYYGIRYGLSG